jgi:hypothetical protein
LVIGIESLRYYIYILIYANLSTQVSLQHVRYRKHDTEIISSTRACRSDELRVHSGELSLRRSDTQTPSSPSPSGMRCMCHVLCGENLCASQVILFFSQGFFIVYIQLFLAHSILKCILWLKFIFERLSFSILVFIFRKG